MAQYVLSYDLRKEGRDYQKLYDELKDFNAVRILESVWCFNRYRTTAKGLLNYFRTFIDDNDGLFVAEITDWDSFNTLGEPVNL